MSTDRLDKILSCTLKAGGVDTKVFRSSDRNCDYVIVTEGTSCAHINSIVEKICLAFRVLHTMPLVEGGRSSDWRIIDGGNIVVHIMNKHYRESYAIEDLLMLL